MIDDEIIDVVHTDKIESLKGIKKTYKADFYFDCTGFKKLLISSVRVKKFCAKTQFNSDKLMQTFTPPYTIEDALKRTLEFEFIEEKKDEIEFFTE